MTWTLSIIGAFILYVGSFGPTAALTRNASTHGNRTGVEFPAWVSTLYQPLLWLRDHTRLGTPIYAWVDWCEGYIPTPTP